MKKLTIRFFEKKWIKYCHYWISSIREMMKYEMKWLNGLTRDQRTSTRLHFLFLLRIRSVDPPYRRKGKAGLGRTLCMDFVSRRQRRQSTETQEGIQIDVHWMAILTNKNKSQNRPLILSNRDNQNWKSTLEFAKIIYVVCAI